MRAINPAHLSLVVDSREQQPYGFERFPVELVRARLSTVDYSLCGLESRAAVERKVLDDLLGCLTVVSCFIQMEAHRWTSRALRIILWTILRWA